MKKSRTAHQQTGLNTKVRLLLVAFGSLVTAHVGYSQANLSTIYSFGNLPDGATPNAPVIIGANGALFGTTSLGGECGYGTVFELNYPVGASWIEAVLHSFCGPDGRVPQASVAFGPGGALYGTTEGGGGGGDTVFQLTPSPSGTLWTESVLYNFATGNHATINKPYGAVLVSGNGVLYTTAQGQSVLDSGGVVALTPPTSPGAAWTESTIFTFGAAPDTGSTPYSGIVSEGGSLFGTTYYGGIIECGVGDGCGGVYQLTPPGRPGGAWVGNPIYAFAGPPNDGGFPRAALTPGKGGVLFGTTFVGGSGIPCNFPNASGCGTVFMLTPPTAPGNAWTETVIHSFSGANGDGAYPVSGVTLGNGGKLYGTTEYGGNSPNCGFFAAVGCGVVYELTPPFAPGGAWIEKILHSFTGQDGDGSVPAASLTISPTGSLYGTTSGGGANGKGTVFVIKP